ncbi:protein cgi121 [Ascobolus immersus RN42]|uniref:EKC/KEOPS complex subunit CGI121 n=1 Tax=Ascobolus immersus RN42 TaxID=1160509 RepID=A0A3N4IP02_ASCIM|nr:protein cgi121 [Ascobolus immersus RN42]
MITITLPPLPGSDRPYPAVHLALYTNVRNAAFLHSQLIAGNKDFDYGFIDASMITSTTHLLTALQRSLQAYVSNTLKTRNVHSEIVFSLSPNNNISKAFTTFGITAASKTLFVFKVVTSPDFTAAKIDSHLKASVEGDEVEINDDAIRGTADMKKILGGYRIQDWRKPDNQKAEVARDDQGALERKVIDAMVLKYVA